MSDRRTAILEAAATVIARRGVRGLRVEELAEEAGVSKALICYHFDDRAGLLRRTLAFVNNRAERYTAEQEASEPLTGPLRRLEQALLLELQDLPHVRENSTAWGELRASAVLAQRLATDFTTDPRFDSPRAVQLRLPGFDLASLGDLGRKVRDLYVGGAQHPDILTARVDDAYLDELAAALTGSLGAKVGIAPRLYLSKLVADVLDRVDEFEDFDPRRHYSLTLNTAELSETERSAATGAGDIALELP
ncbi:BREX system ATP-binding domain-containing protein [Streptomyces sp. NPDC091406]|uniref:BREX system ATP-binding domain-containing protein n=1 Tax=unclassified Streptomyces TaxID=2593676 RepID=UPI0038082DB3